MNKNLETLKAQLALNQEARTELEKQIAEIEQTENHSGQIAKYKGKYFKSAAGYFLFCIDVIQQDNGIFNIVWADQNDGGFQKGIGKNFTLCQIEITQAEFEAEVEKLQLALTLLSV